MNNQAPCINTPSAKKKKILYVEILRIICIVLVIFNHTNYLGYVYFLSFDIGSLPYWFYMVFTVITGISIPMFFMISGMLLLGKNESIGYIWKKRISKYVVILFIFSLIYYLMNIDFDLPSFSIKDFFTKLYTDGVIIPFWFIYAYLSFLIILPFVRKISKNITEKEFIYLLLIHFVFTTVLEIAEYVIFHGSKTINQSFHPAFICNVLILYPITGYYLGNRVKKITNKMLCVSFGLFLLSVVTTMFITNFRLNLTGEITEENVNVFIHSARPFQVIFVFLLVRKLFENKKIPLFWEKLITHFGSCVFGIYLIEHAYREGFYFIYYFLCTKMDRFLAIWIYVLFVFFICLFQVAAFRFVKGFIRKVFNSKNES